MNDDVPKCPTCGTPGVKVVKVELFDCGYAVDDGKVIFPCKFYDELGGESPKLETPTDA